MKRLSGHLRLMIVVLAGFLIGSVGSAGLAWCQHTNDLSESHVFVQERASSASEEHERLEAARKLMCGTVQQNCEDIPLLPQSILPHGFSPSLQSQADPALTAILLPGDVTLPTPHGKIATTSLHTAAFFLPDTRLASLRTVVLLR